MQLLQKLASALNPQTSKKPETVSGHAQHPVAQPVTSQQHTGTTSGAANQEAAKVLGHFADPKTPAAKKEPAKPAGLYPGVTDLTGTYGKLAAGTRSETNGVVLHRTETPTAQGALNAYNQRIKNGDHVGAQYLIDEAGKTDLIAPADSLMYHAKGFNSSALGIEVVGPGVHLDRSGKDKSLRDQVTDLNLSPELESRLLGYSDKQLNNVVKWNGDTIYEDISGKQKRAVLVYMRQEGRGIGLINKLRAYQLQDQGFDTVDANLRLGFAVDSRDFGVAARMLKLLGQTQVRLLTNNPEKVAGLESSGIKVVERVPHQLPSNPHNERYLATKRDRTGHQL